MFKHSKDIETDAAPSRPRTEEEIESSQSDCEEEQEQENRKNSSKDTEFERFSKPSKNSRGSGDSHVTTNNIKITDCSHVHIGHNLVINRGQTKSREDDLEQQTAPAQPPPHIQKLFEIRKPVSQSDLIAIKYEIGQNWRRLAEELGLTRSAVLQIDKQYQHAGTDEVIYQLLLKWKESQPRTTATVGILCQALWNCSEPSAANVLSKLHSEH